MPPALGQDPFYLVRQELQENVTDLQQKLSRFQGLSSSTPVKQDLAQTIGNGCDSVKWQLNELEKAVDIAAVNPQKFNLTQDELSSRRRWIQDTRRQVDGLKDMVKSADLSTKQSAALAVENRFVAANNNFLNNESQKQQMLMRQQDQHLDDISVQVSRVGMMAGEMGEELEKQTRMLDELEETVDTTSSRLKSAVKRMSDIIRKSGSNTQLILIGVLIVILIVLAIFVFY